MKQPEREAALHRSIALFFICAALLWGASCIAAPGELGDADGDNDNPHNLSSLSKNTIKSNSTEICVFCHTPHGATPDSTLWGRPDPDGPVGGFQTFDATRVRDGSDVLGIAEAAIVDDSKYGVNDADNEYPNGASKLCLSCHDGVTALGVTVRGVDLLVSGSIGEIDLETSHPISFYYTEAIMDDINALSKFYKMPDTTVVPLDWDERVQCTICHEPHMDTKEGTYTLPFWRAAQKIDETADYNRICDQCHTTADYYPQTDGTIHNIPVVP